MKVETEALGVIKILWSANWWDGPMSGLCSIGTNWTMDGQFAYFKWVEDVESEETHPPRRYAVYRLTPEQYLTLMDQHVEFMRTVRLNKQWLTEREAGAGFYSKERPELHLEDGEVLGYFVM